MQLSATKITEVIASIRRPNRWIETRSFAWSRLGNFPNLQQVASLSPDRGQSNGHVNSRGHLLSDDIVRRPIKSSDGGSWSQHAGSAFVEDFRADDLEERVRARLALPGGINSIRRAWFDRLLGLIYHRASFPSPSSSTPRAALARRRDEMDPDRWRAPEMCIHVVEASRSRVDPPDRKFVARPVIFTTLDGCWARACFRWTHRELVLPRNMHDNAHLARALSTRMSDVCEALFEFSKVSKSRVSRGRD